MKKTLKWKIVEADFDSVSIQITEQSHIDKHFGNVSNGHVFCAKNGIKLNSYGYPDYKNCWGLYVFGTDSKFNNNIVKIPRNKFELVVEALKEYVNFDFPDEYKFPIYFVYDGKGTSKWGDVAYVMFTDKYTEYIVDINGKSDRHYYKDYDGAFLGYYNHHACNSMEVSKEQAEALVRTPQAKRVPSERQVIVDADARYFYNNRTFSLVLFSKRYPNGVYLNTTDLGLQSYRGLEETIKKTTDRGFEIKELATG